MAQMAGMASGISGMIGSNMQQAASRGQLYEQAGQAEASIADIDLQAVQRSEARALKLNQALSAVESRRASSGLSLDSPTAQAIERNIRSQSYRQGSVEASTAAQQRLGLMEKARMLKAAGYEAGRLLDLKFGLGMNPGSHLFTKEGKDAMYSGNPNMTSEGKYKARKS
jgi:hypothetical protein